LVDRRAWIALAVGGVMSLVGLLLLPVVAVLGLYAYFQVTDRIFPGVKVGPVAVEGMTVEEAAVELHAAWNLGRKVPVYDGIQVRELSPAELGVSLDPGRTAEAAYGVARGQGLAAGVSDMLRGYRQAWEVEPVVSFDPDAARAGLQSLAVQVSQPPVDASFYLEGTQLVEAPGKLGYTINIPETQALLAASPRTLLEGGVLNLKLQPVAPRITDVSASMAEARRLLETPVSIRAYDPLTDETLDLPVPKESLAAWLRVENGEAGPQVGVDETRAAEYLSQLSATLGQARYIDGGQYGLPLAQAVREGGTLTVQLRHSPTQYKVESGDTLLKIGWKVGIPFWMILEANPGLDPDHMWAGQEITLPSKDELLPLPVAPGKRIVISISKQRLWVYENGERIKDFVISTGIDRSPTQPGVFQVQTHDRNAYASVWDLNMPNFLGIYEAWPGFMNGIHGLPTLSNGRRLWANILGRPASYGCIILDLDDAEWLFEWAEAGVVVEIRG
jgi:LysM repeat protein